ncbi:DNA internalization-related competence protein ComEC/Rec2 [Neisseria perflava]|uniref:DNA internalization-related competence protein ComEC/Rec2 n=1 Tax=Neisseria perflava TaxID=33053 RepID=UPI0020A0EB0F|nr:DNA internalization-related competence protein ComEC/Rec2 [Neisseria perflava]MCP1659526.1 competence protein ComEC [Neisseria perflava]MCP1772523.1 competence protein ComEC [Neisseria perflava]
MLRYMLPCWVAGVVVSFALPSVPLVEVWAAAFCVLSAAAWRFRGGRAFQTAWLLLAVLLGAAYGVWRTERALARQWPLGQTEQVALTVEVADMPRRDEKRVQFQAKARRKDGREFVLLLSDYQGRGWTVGSRWKISARVRPVIGEVNLRGFDREAWALGNGIGGVGTVGKGREMLSAGRNMGLAVWRERISRNWQPVSDDEHHGFMPSENNAADSFSDGIALMKALSIGEQSALRPALWQVFRPLGLTHLVSISGLHVTMIAVLAGWLLKRLLRFLPFTPARPRLWILCGGVAGALFYALMAGFAVPTQRSVLMLAAFAWAWWRGRGTAVWAGWWQALAAVLLFDPLAVLGVGTWLSFGLVAALIWGGAGRLKQGAWQMAVRGQWAATVWSVVLLGWFFASLPLLSPLVNAVAIPWFSWVLTPLALLGSLLPFAPLQYLGAALAEYTLRGIVWLADIAPEWGVAAAPWPLLMLAGMAALLLLLPRGTGLRPLACVALTGFIFYRPAPVAQGRLNVMVMDAGQGLAVLFQTASHTLLFDTGTAQAASAGVVPSLNALGVRRLDKSVLSHHDSDHDGGYPFILRAQPPDKIAAGQPEFYPQAGLCREARWQWDGVAFELLRPSENGSAEDNDQSCILRAVAGGEALLVTGDLGQKGEAALVEKYGSALFSQVLLLGHHGSNSASSGVFLNAVSPQYAVASSGYANAYGHPTAAVQNRVRAHGATLLRTDVSGALLFELGGEGEVFQGRLKTDKFYWQRKPLE